jgi:hypothetical protein
VVAASFAAMPSDRQGRFRSHKHYVEALAWIGGRTLLISDANALEVLATRFAGSGGVHDKPPPTIDYSQVQRSLRNAWSTELLLALPGRWTEEDEFIRLANSWAVIQAYYVGYHATQAVVVAKGERRPTSHPKTQQLYASLWVDRPVELAPWSLGIGANGWKNRPDHVTIEPDVHPWSNCDDTTCWSLAAKVLKSTRDDAVRRSFSAKRDEGQRARRQAWTEEEALRVAAGRRPRKVPAFSRPQLTVAEKAACDRRVRSYHFLTICGDFALAPTTTMPQYSRRVRTMTSDSYISYFNARIT